jgi:magnesium-transporting ATPase (P-type)
LNEFTVLTLIGAGGVSLVLELWLAAKEGRDANVIESVSILAAVVVVVLVSAGNNWQKERQFRALEEVQSKSVVRAIRDGVEISLPVERVVVGDLLMLETGDILCADGVLVRGFNIRYEKNVIDSLLCHCVTPMRCLHVLQSGRISFDRGV